MRVDDTRVASDAMMDSLSLKTNNSKTQDEEQPGVGSISVSEATKSKNGGK